MAIYKARSFLDGISQPYLVIPDKNNLSDGLISRDFVIEDGFSAYFFGQNVTINSGSTLTIVGTVYLIFI